MEDIKIVQLFWDRNKSAISETSKKYGMQNNKNTLEKEHYSNYYIVFYEKNSKIAVGVNLATQNEVQLTRCD